MRYLTKTQFGISTYGVSNLREWATSTLDPKQETLNSILLNL